MNDRNHRCTVRKSYNKKKDWRKELWVNLRKGEKFVSRATNPVFTNYLVGTISGETASMDHSEMGKDKKMIFSSSPTNAYFDF